jgi:hypothetical protein
MSIKEAQDAIRKGFGGVNMKGAADPRTGGSMWVGGLYDPIIFFAATSEDRYSTLRPPM